MWKRLKCLFYGHVEVMFNTTVDMKKEIKLFNVANGLEVFKGITPDLLAFCTCARCGIVMAKVKLPEGVSVDSLISPRSLSKKV